MDPDGATPSKPLVPAPGVPYNPLMPVPLPHRWFERRLLTSGGRKIAYYTIAHSLYSLLAGGFEIALILRLTGSFERIVFFNLLYFILLYVAFVAGTLLLRSGKAGRGFRLDLLVQVLMCGYMMLNFGSLGNSLVLAGFFLLKGTSEGLFWSTRHSALIHSIHNDRRDKWSLGLQTITIILGVILPVLSGFAISELTWPVPLQVGNHPLPVGYFPVYALTGFLALGALVFSPSMTIPPQTVHLRPMASLRRSPFVGSWVGYQSCGAVVSISVTIAVGILNFSVLKTELNMGLFSSGIAVASAFFFFGIRRLIRRFNLTRLKMVAVGSSGEFLSRLIFTVFPTVPGLVGKSLLDSFILPLRTLFGENIVRRRVELLTTGRGLSVAEGVLFQETILFVARLAGCLGLILVLDTWKFEPATVARWVLVLFLGYSFIDFTFLRVIEKGNRKLEKA